MSKTKEEILYPKVRTKSGVRDALFNSDGLLINHDILEAMDEYANQQKHELEIENQRLKWKVNDLTMDNMAHEYNEAEAEKFRPEYERQLLEPLTTTLSLIHSLALSRSQTLTAIAGDEILKILNT